MAERRDNKKRKLWKGEYQKSDGRYMYRYTDSRGNARFIYSWCLTSTDRPPSGKHSDKCLRELEKEIAKDIQDEIDSFKARRYTLNAFFTEYIEQKKEIKPSTRGNYKYMYKKYVWDSIGKLTINNIRYSDIKKFYNHLINDLGFKPNSMEIIHTIIHPIFSTAVRDGYIRVNPTDGVMAEIKRSHNWEKPKRNALTIKEQEAFVDFIWSHEKYKRWRLVITVLLGTGCRVGEITGLTWGDCDFRNKIISINHTLIYRPDENTRVACFSITTPKTKAGIREVPMMSDVAKLLVEEKMRQMREGFNKSVVDGYSGFIFSNRFGDPLSAHNINRALNRIVRDYNIEESEEAERQGREPLLLPHFSVHNLRHTFCTRMCENETNIKVIQEIMGHSDITTTMDIYNEATRDAKKQSMEHLDDKIKIC